MMSQKAHKEPKNICFFCGDMTRCGGTEKVSITVANMLHRAGRCRVFFLSLTESDPEPFFPLESGIERHYMNKKWINPGPGYIPMIPKLRRFLKEREIDVIIDIDVVLDCLSIPAAKGLKTKVISWEHFNLQFEQSVLYRRLILKYSVKRSDYVVTLTEGDRAQYRKTLGRGERIRAIYNPMEPAVLEPGVTRENQIITVGRLAPEKGVDYLAEVAEIVLHKHPDWTWVLLGEGGLRPKLEAEICARHLEGRLILKGRVQDVGSCLQRSKIYVMTSLYEGFPLCLLEAKAYGLPCIAFDVPTGPAELIADGVNGVLIPAFSTGEMAGKILNLMGNGEILEKFSENAGMGLEKCDSAHILAQWHEIIDEICE